MGVCVTNDPVRLSAILAQLARVGEGEYRRWRRERDSTDEIEAIAMGVSLLAEAHAEERDRREAAEYHLRTVAEAYESSPALSCSVDARTGVISRCNRALCVHLGRSREQVVGKPLHAIYCAEGAEHAADCLAAVQQGRAIPHGDHLLAGATGQLRAALAISRDPVGASTEPQVHLAYVDITRMRQAEVSRSDTQGLRSLERLSGLLAHELNDLLTSTLGSAALMRSTVSNEGQADLAQITASAQRTADLTSQLLAFSGRAAARPEAVRLSAMVSALTPELHRALGPRVRMRVLDVGSGLVVQVDPGHLERMLLDLAAFGRDSMPSGGIWTISAWVLRDDPAPAALGNRICLTLQDNGDSVPPEFMPRLFEPYVTSRELGRGTGLGLAAVHGYALRAGGELRARPTQSGTRFELLLPPGRAGAVTAEPVRRAPRLHGYETILVVDDEPMTRQLLDRVLSSAGYRVLVSDNGVQALARARAQDVPLDLVLTDLVMPEMQGLELVRHLHEEGLCGRVLVVSGYPEPQTANQHGLVSGFMSKPFSPASLLAEVRQLLDRPAARRADEPS